MDDSDKKRLEYIEQRERKREERSDLATRVIIGVVIGGIMLIAWYMSSTSQ